MKKSFKVACSLMAATVLTVTSSFVVFAAENTTEITESSPDNSAQIEINIEVNSTFTVGIPVSADLNPDDGTGSYSISVKGDLDPRYKLVVAPIDEYTAELGDTTSNINFLLKDASNALSPKADVVVDITTGQTEFICTDINDETPITVDNTMSISSGKLSAGAWKGTMRYSISLELLPTSP